jgi:hypothetical protein
LLLGASDSEEVANPREVGAACVPSGAKRETGSPLGNTLGCPSNFGLGWGETKHVRGGAGKPALRWRKGKPQRGERQEGMVRIGYAWKNPLLGGKTFEVVCGD